MSVRWEDDKNPWDGVAVSYDTSSNTYVFSGTLSVPAEGTGNQATLICSDPQNDSIKIDGGDGVAVNTSRRLVSQIRHAAQRMLQFLQTATLPQSMAVLHLTAMVM